MGILITGITGFFAGQAHAISFGDTILIEWLFPDTGTTYDSWTVVVGPGVEVPDAGGVGIDIDIDAATPEIEFDFASSLIFMTGSFNGFRFFDTLSSIADFADVTIFSSNLAGFDASRLSFDSDNIYVNFQSLITTTSTLVQLDVAPVPEPSTMLLFSAGLVGLFGLGRKKFFKRS